MFSTVRTVRPWRRRHSAIAGLLSLLFATSLVIAFPAAAATTLYVDSSSPTCANAGPGSQAIPFCTIRSAANVAIAGQTVQVAAGDYPENISIANSGTQSAPIVFQPAPGALVRVGNAQTRAFTVSGKSWIQIKGFTVSGTTGIGIYLKNASNITLSGNRVTQTGLPVNGSTAQGIYVANTNDSLIVGNTVDHNSDSGIYLTSGSTRNEIRGNVSFANARVYTRAANGIDVRTPGNTIVKNVTHDNEDSGIQLYNGATNCVVVGNISYKNGDHGIDVLNSPGVVVVANTVYKSANSGINLEGQSGGAGSSGGTVANNISVDNGLTGTGAKGNIRVDATSTPGTKLDYDLLYLSSPGKMVSWGTTSYTSLAAFTNATGQEVHGLQTDPKWKAAASDDLHLAAGSPAIDSANSAAASEPTTDAGGDPRVDDPATPNSGVGPRTFDDRGAFEYQSDLPPNAALTVTPASGTVPFGVTADASASTDADLSPISTYTFEFGDGTVIGPQAGATAVHSYQAPGSYTVKVTVTDTAGLSSVAVAQVVANPSDFPPTAALTVTPASGSVPLAVTADASASTDPDPTPIATYAFDFGDGTAVVGPQAGSTATHTYQSAGAYTVTVTVVDTAGNASTSTAGVTAGTAAVDELHYTYLGSTSVALDWRGGPSSIRYGTTSTYGSVADAQTPIPVPVSSAGPFWEVVLGGLEPGTTYHYSIGGGPDRTFTSAPAGPFRFDAEGDIGDSSSYRNMATTQAQIASDNPAFVLAVGDLTYADGHGQAHVDQHFNDVMSWSQTAAYMPAWGNHEWEPGDDLRNYYGRFDIPNQHASPGAPSLGCCGEDWGWFDAGGVRFI